MHPTLLVAFLALVAPLYAQVLEVEAEDGSDSHYVLSMQSAYPAYTVYMDTNDTDAYTFRLTSVFEINSSTKQKYSESVVQFVAWTVSQVVDHDDEKTWSVDHGV
jgi:hypothetical protein